MPKEKNYNPVAAQRKADKAKAIKKSMPAPVSPSKDRFLPREWARRREEKKIKRQLLANVEFFNYPDKAELQDRRNEKLARKNPGRIQKQIDDLKAITEKGGKLTRHEEQVLEGLEREHKAVTKAREVLGDKAPSYHRGGGDSSRHGAAVLGKRRRGSPGAESSEEEDIPEDVRSIPMPRDTPPPIPKEVMDEWYAKRRARRNAEQGNRHGGPGNRGDGKESAENSKEAKAAPAVESKTVYEAAPVKRDLQQEAVSAFVPSAVRTKVNKGAGQGGLMEPEEADKLEEEGYLKKMEDRSRSNEAETEGEAKTEAPASRKVTVEDVVDEDD